MTQEPSFRENIKRISPPRMKALGFASRPSFASFRGDWSGICVTAAKLCVIPARLASSAADVIAPFCINLHPWHRGHDGGDAHDANAARLLSRAGGRLVTLDLLQADIHGGAPVNPDGTLNLVHYAAWPVKEMAGGD